MTRKDQCINTQKLTLFGLKHCDIVDLFQRSYLHVYYLRNVLMI